MPVSFLLHVLMASQAVGASVSGRHRGRWQAAVSARRKFECFYGVVFLSVDRLSLFCSCFFFSFFVLLPLVFFSALVFLLLFLGQPKGKIENLFNLGSA